MTIDEVAIDFLIKCQYCNDAGVVHPRLPNGKPDYSETVPCRHCRSPQDIAQILGVSSMGSTLDSLKSVPGIVNAIKYARQLVTLKTEWKLMLLYGINGNGKTHILEGIAIALWDKGYYARIQTYPDFMANLKNTFDRDKKNDENTFEQIFKTTCNIPFLLLDDVGSAGSFTEFSQSQLERLILTRYRENSFTVLTTNRNIKELPLSVYSRFNDPAKARLVHNAAADYRPHNKKT